MTNIQATRRSRRDLLLRSQLPDFIKWVKTRGYIVHPVSPRSQYEVARIELYDQSGNLPHMVFYRSLKTDYLTTPFEATPLIAQYHRAKFRKAHPHIAAIWKDSHD